MVIAQGLYGGTYDLNRRSTLHPDSLYAALVVGRMSVVSTITTVVGVIVQVIVELSKISGRRRSPLGGFATALIAVTLASAGEFCAVLVHGCG